MQSPKAAAFISWSSQSHICVHFYKITWNLIFYVVEQLKVTALRISLGCSLGSASLWMHPLGSRERSTPTLPVHLAISTKNQLCLVKDLAVTGYWALQGIIWEGTFHSHCSALQIPIKAICYNMNISPAFFLENCVKLSGSLGGFCFHREFATHSAKPTTTSACGSMSSKWLSLLWTGCIPGHPASRLSQPIWWNLAQTRYCREKALESSGAQRLL